MRKEKIYLIGTLICFEEYDSKSEHNSAKINYLFPTLSSLYWKEKSVYLRADNKLKTDSRVAIKYQKEKEEWKK